MSTIAGAGAYCGGPTTDRTAFLSLNIYQFYDRSIFGQGSRHYILEVTRMWNF